MSSFTIAGLYAWAPGVEDMDKWRSWAEGRLSIEDSREVPQLDHMSKVSKRRLSQLSKMVLHVGHELLKTQPVDHMILCSNYGEICQQYKITQGLLENHEVRPANFSLSVFNTPLSLLSIEEKSRISVDVLLAGQRGLCTALQSLIAQLEYQTHQRILLIFADEALPDDYKVLVKEKHKPYAFAMIVSSQGHKENLYNFSSDIIQGTPFYLHPLKLLKWLLTPSDVPLSVANTGNAIFKLTRGQAIDI